LCCWRRLCWRATTTQRTLGATASMGTVVSTLMARVEQASAAPCKCSCTPDAHSDRATLLPPCLAEASGRRVLARRILDRWPMVKKRTTGHHGQQEGCLVRPPPQKPKAHSNFEWCLRPVETPHSLRLTHDAWCTCCSHVAHTHSHVTWVTRSSHSLTGLTRGSHSLARHTCRSSTHKRHRRRVLCTVRCHLLQQQLPVCVRLCRVPLIRDVGSWPGPQCGDETRNVLAACCLRLARVR
jgi:hypothetical protein